MIAVGMVQVPLHEVIHVISVGHGRVPASRAVDVVLGVTLALVAGGAGGGIGGGDLDDVLIHVSLVRMVEVAIVQVVHVPLMLDGEVAAAWSVLMGVVGVSLTMAHKVSWWAHGWVRLRRG